jgi:hypothetical protein
MLSIIYSDWENQNSAIANSAPAQELLGGGNNQLAIKLEHNAHM